MPGYKGHLAGGVVAYAITLSDISKRAQSHR